MSDGPYITYPELPPNSLTVGISGLIRHPNRVVQWRQDRFTNDLEEPLEFIQEVHQWCVDQIMTYRMFSQRGAWEYIGLRFEVARPVIIFANTGDLILFRLRWL